MTKRFALTGAAGYIAPRHYQAIAATGCDLAAVLDPHDSVGGLDSYFPDAAYFREFERFDRYLEKLRRAGEGVDYVSVCSPNHLHDAHVRAALRLRADAICEKPLVLTPDNCRALMELEQEHGRKIHPVLQLRLHPEIQALRRYISTAPEDHLFKVDLTYITSRGAWYLYSWKGDEEKSGGLATNIGVHFFDMLIWLFGRVRWYGVSEHTRTSSVGRVRLETAEVEWNLSIDAQKLPAEAVEAGQRTWRHISVDGKEIEFSGGFTDLHTRVYEEALAGNGFSIEDALPAIEFTHTLRTEGAEWHARRHSRT
jgi:UDP-N-acetyl-2-amino-2-deoxyglucuronate dehydrogenase